jgi:hypothetical protein
MAIEQPQLLFSRPPPSRLHNQFAVVVARAFGFPRLLNFGVGVLSVVQATVTADPGGMDGADEIGTVGVEQARFAFWKFGHGLVKNSPHLSM